MIEKYNFSFILVFDGKHRPPLKEASEERRKKASKFRTDALNFFQQKRFHLCRHACKQAAILNFQGTLWIAQKIAQTNTRNLNVFVSFLEAEAQLRYLQKKNEIEIIFTEDTDFFAYKSKNIVFSVSAKENSGIFFRNWEDNLVSPDIFQGNFDKFRLFCSMIGNDYLKRIPGVGIKILSRFIKDLDNIPAKFSTFRPVLKEKFASRFNETTFVQYFFRLHQTYNLFQFYRVFDWESEKVVPLNPVDNAISWKKFGFLGPIQLNLDECFHSMHSTLFEKRTNLLQNISGDVIVCEETFNFQRYLKKYDFLKMNFI